MKKSVLIVLLSITTLSILLSQEEKKNHHISIGLNGGIGSNFNAYRLSADDKGFTYYGINPHYAYGMDLGFLIKNKIRIRASISYHEMEYGMYWNNYTEFDKTITQLNNLNLGLHVDYSIYSSKRLQLFISPALTGELVLKDQHENILSDGDTNDKDYNVLSNQYPAGILGANMAFPVRYKLINHFYLTLTPGYTCFLKNFTSDNDKLYQRVNLNFGLEFTFW